MTEVLEDQTTEPGVSYGFDALTEDGNIVRIVSKLQQDGHDGATLVLVDDAGNHYQRSEIEAGRLCPIDVMGDVPDTEPITVEETPIETEPPTIAEPATEEATEDQPDGV